jgi:DNA phosphorothioation-dependent restriction protein DptG
VLGSIGSSADFEYEVARIYQNARTTAEINASFQQIQMDFFDKIESAKEVTERKLFEHFDENVAERFQTRSREVGDALDRNERMLMTLT